MSVKWKGITLLDHIDFLWAVEDFLIDRGWVYVENQGWYRHQTAAMKEVPIMEALWIELRDRWIVGDFDDIHHFAAHMNDEYKKRKSL